MRRFLVATIALAAACPGAESPAETMRDALRRYVVLVDALAPTDDATAHDAESLVVEWVPPAEVGQSPRIESVRPHAPRSDELPRDRGRITIAGDTFSGELAWAATRHRPQTVWRFAGPMARDGGDGTYTVEADGSETRGGRARIIVVHDVGTLGGGALRAWLPPGDAPVRGLFIWGNGGRNDDRHEVVRDLWLGFCRLHRFALIAMGGYASEMVASDRSTLQRQLTALAAASAHPELETAPILFTGHSAGGMTAWTYNVRHPERVIAFTVSRAAVPGLPNPSATARSNPAMLVIGDQDRGEFNAAVQSLFLTNRAKGAPWSFAIEPDTGHSLGRTPQLWLPFFDWAVRARVNADAAELRPVDPGSGWLVVHRGGKPGERPYGPAAQISAAPRDTSWFPNENVLLAYLGMISREPALRPTIAPQRGIFRIGEAITVHVPAFSAADWPIVQLMINGAAVGRVRPDAPSFTWRAEEPGVFTATIIARPARDGPLHFAGPVCGVVEPEP